MPETTAAVPLRAVQPDVTFAGDRVDIALEASHELESLLQEIGDQATGLRHKAAKSDEFEISRQTYVLRGLARRAYELNDIIMAILGQDDLTTTEGCVREVIGRASEVTP